MRQAIGVFATMALMVAQNGWTVSAADVRDRFAASAGADPIFRLVDGATCPTDDVSTLSAKRRAYKLLPDKGLIRIGLPLPSAPNLEFSVAAVANPYGCTTNPATGLTSPPTGIMSMYRRPLPSTNLGFLTAIMWDRRESSLARGEEAYNTTKINITGVAGLNDDALNLPSIAGFCDTCHDTPNVGNHLVKAPLNIGFADAGANSPPALDISELPVFTPRCNRACSRGRLLW